MATRKKIDEEIGSLASLGGIITTYKEIAASRITRTRTSVLKSHDFVGEINGVFQRVKSSYKNQVEALAKQNKGHDPSKFSFIKNNGRGIDVFLSSNTGLYGDIVRRTFDLFFEQTNMNDHEVLIIGKLGLFLAKGIGIPKEYQYFDFPDQKMDDDTLRDIVAYLIQYEHVYVYHQEFKTLVRQIAVVEDISGNVVEPEQKNVVPVKYLFEPSLEKVLEFFEKEIFASIFEQTIKDSQLAKFAARLVTLDAASENIRKRLNHAVFDAIRIKHREKNRKQSQTFASMSLWK
ncbi:MAG TPA: FoF1 ATP synthase subunit gamma [Patescibacteria group bacterium]|nr:FoF1 ATP synthase subunit gamma [Patescibacteria group bacterium]